MKQLAVVILSCIILISASPQATTYWTWKINQRTIAAVLCVKKAIVGNTCQGKCHLKSQFESNEDESSTAPLTEVEVNLIHFYCVKTTDVEIFAPFIHIEKTNPITYLLLHDRLNTEQDLRPPEFLS